MRHFIFILLFLLAADAASAAASIRQLQQLIAQQQFAAAVQNGEQLLHRNPGHIRGRFLTAYASQMDGQRERAIAHYRELIDNNPALPEPRNNLAMIYLASGEHERASQLLVEAIHTHPSYATAYDNLSRIYNAIASQAYKRALSDSGEISESPREIKLSAIARLESEDLDLAEDDGGGEPGPIEIANQETLLIESVKLWAKAWADKDFAGYAGFYSSSHRAKFETHEQWLAQRRARILRPGEINVKISNLRIKWRSDNSAIIDFTQAFESPRYSDRVVKRLGFERSGAQWKISEERVLSVL